ncbi:MAG: glycosyltransferase family 2 protein [Gammaproteobacteria bacterium]|nr:glycosyltransferase family 2 protein [Gammaproteobacteria bacterium]
MVRRRRRGLYHRAVATTGGKRRVTPSVTHLVLIPSYNPGAKGVETVRAARQFWAPVWVVVDGSTDGSKEQFLSMAASDRGLRVIVRSSNGGKGAALLEGLIAATEAGFTHALTMDSDGQHPAPRIPEFMQASMQAPEAMILGEPVFDETAPRERIRGRKIANLATHIETMSGEIRDSLFGFRVYPIEPLVAVMRQTSWMRRFDFDAEAVVRLNWRGVPAINIPVPVRYYGRHEGGVSHFNYWRDNVLLTSMYLRLASGWLIRIPMLLARRLRRRLVGTPRSLHT